MTISMYSYIPFVYYKSTQARSKLLSATLCLCASVFLFLGCEETPLPEPSTGEVVFYAKGNLEGASLDIEAGIDDYYMSSSHGKDALNVLTFQGNLSRPSCRDCGEELLIEISNNELLEDGQSPNIDNALQVGSYFYRNQNTVSDIYVVDFQSENSGTSGIESSSWDFGDGGLSTEVNPQYSYEAPTDLNPEVCLTTRDENGCTSLICNEVSLDSTDCTVDFAYEMDESTGFVSFMDLSEGVPPLQHRWNFGDGFGASLGNPGYYFGNMGAFQVCLTVTDATGCKKTLCKNIGTDPSFCSSNFTYSVNKVVGPQVPQLSKVLVQWTDENGKVYRSDKQPQAASSNFEILSSDAYSANEKGEATRKLEIQFSCVLYAEDGSTRQMDIREAVIAVAHP